MQQVIKVNIIIQRNATTCRDSKWVNFYVEILIGHVTKHIQCSCTHRKLKTVQNNKCQVGPAVPMSSARGGGEALRARAAAGAECARDCWRGSLL